MDKFDLLYIKFEVLNFIYLHYINFKISQDQPANNLCGITTKNSLLSDYHFHRLSVLGKGQKSCLILGKQLSVLGLLFCLERCILFTSVGISIFPNRVSPIEKI